MSRMISFSIYTCIVSEKGSLWSNIAIACQEKSCKQLEAISKWPLRMLYSVLISWWQDEHFRKLLIHKKTIDNMSDDSLTCISKAKKILCLYCKVSFQQKAAEANLPRRNHLSNVFQVSSALHSTCLDWAVVSRKHFSESLHVRRYFDKILICRIY